MMTIVPAFLLLFGIICVVKPEWIVMNDRRQKAAGTTRRSEEIEFTDGHYVFIQVVGFFIGVFGLVYTLRAF